MKKLLIALALSGSVLFAQNNIIGTWQGALKLPNAELRTVIKISMGDDVLKVAFYSIDQRSPAIPASEVKFEGSTLKMTIAQIGGSYEGKLSADGNSITGTFTQMANPLPLNLTRATAATAWEIPEPPPPPTMMAADAKPSFEVATIKPSKPDARFSLLVGRNGILTTTNTSLSDLIKFAYNVHPRQITGGPGWYESDKYDVTAKPDTAGLPNVEQLKAMVQKLLTERFQLTFHRDKKELSVYAITVAKSGSKLTKSDTQNGLPGFGGGGRGRFGVRNSTMTEFASFLQSNIVERPVVDQTGFAATRYNFTLAWTPDAAQLAGAGGNAPPPPPDNADAPPDLFAAFQQQLGLKLEATKAPVEVIVIDKVEKPSEN